jgi:hypothetical protein
MNNELYKVSYLDDHLNEFEFYSEGPRGLIRKKIEITPTEYPEIYNLEFGDVNEDGSTDIYAVSDNGDRDKILSTIVYVIDVYLEKYPYRHIFFAGSTESRNRLYRITIARKMRKRSSNLAVYSQNEKGIMRFKRNIVANAFLIRKRI